jgi:hypothetical protein
MRSIRISEEVWDAIAEKGVFGETPDIVLRRVFGIEDSGRVRGDYSLNRGRRARIATNKLTSIVEDNQLFLEFASGENMNFILPDPDDRNSVRKVTEDAMQFAKNNGATTGQIAAVRKTLNEAGFHLTK